MSNALLDKDFLKRLDEWTEREVYVKIISLDFAENPRTEITGYATGGSVKVDGASVVRRVCSLNMIAENAKVNEIDWALESKFKLEIGLKNFIEKKYDPIIWFPLGVYIITSFAATSNAQGYSISIQGKDKMCLLDGSVGGNLFATHDFGKLEIQHADGSKEYDYILIYDIIKNAIHEYALEPYENIIINDLEDCAVELLEYRAKNKDLIVYNSKLVDDVRGITAGNIAFAGNRIFNMLKDSLPGDKIIDAGMEYELVKYVGYGDTVGYRLTDLTYAGDLILGAGSTITQMLDALVKMLGEFEYFYDLQGRFVFQRKKIYYNASWTNAITNERETYYDSVENGSENAYEFTKGILIESYNNKPDLTNIKNDYTIWGSMTGVNNIDYPVHLRCAIDDKPTQYSPLNDNGRIWATHEYITNDNDDLIQADVLCDWREIIYQMASDYMISDSKIAELTKLIAATDENGEVEFEDKTYYIDDLKKELSQWETTWDTRYVPYYTDLLGFWRILYDIEKNEWADNMYWNPDYIVCERKYIYITDEENKYTNKKRQYKYNEKTGKYEINSEDGTHKRLFDHDELKMVNHESFIFWLDFLDDAYLEKYKPSNIGRRTKVINDTEVKAIFFEGTPNVLFIDPNNTEPQTDTSLSYVRLNLVGGMANYFQISTQGKSAKETLDSLIYQHTYYCEGITLNCIPIYYLQPNVRISVYDQNSGINGEYIIKSYNLQLAYNGSMSITASKAEDLIL